MSTWALVWSTVKVGVQWFQTYSPWIFGSLLPSVVVGLSVSPKTRGAAQVIKDFLHFFSVLSYKDENNMTFKLPFTGRKKELMPVVKTVIMLLCLLSGSCGPNSAVIGRNIGSSLIDCAASGVATEVGNLMPAVSAIVRTGTANWDDQLHALESLGVSSVACAVDAVLKNLITTAAPRVSPEDEAVVARCRTYLAKAKVPIKS